MSLQKYNLIVLGNLKGIDDEINSFAENRKDKLKTDSILFTSFESAFLVNEVKELFKISNRKFVLFEDGVDNFYNSLELKELKQDPDYQTIYIDPFTTSCTGDFSNIKTIKEIILNEFMSKIIENQNTFTPYEINNMSDETKKDVLNNILDKGPDNLNEKDKELLTKLISNN